MIDRRAARPVLFAAGVLSVSMGSAHLWLPQIFGWAAAMQDAPDSLQWALAALNVFWSVLTLVMGLLVLAVAYFQWWSQPAARWLLVGLSAYWAVHSVYVGLYPFPLPNSLAWLGTAFLTFAIVQALLHLGGALARQP